MLYPPFIWPGLFAPLFIISKLTQWWSHSFYLNCICILSFYSIHYEPFLDSLLLLQYHLECLHKEVLTTSNHSSLHLLSNTYFLSTPSVSLSRAQTHWVAYLYTQLEVSRVLSHTLWFFRGYQSAECKLSPRKTVTCHQRCLAPRGNPLSSWHQNKSLFPW